MTSHGWFDVVRFPDGITMIAEPGHHEDVKSFLIEGERDVAVLDTGMGVDDFAGLVRSLSSRDPIVFTPMPTLTILEQVLNTSGFWCMPRRRQTWKPVIRMTASGAGLIHPILVTSRCRTDLILKPRKFLRQLQAGF